MWHKHFHPVSSELFFRSQKTGDPRFGEISRCISKGTPQKSSYLIAGYPDDDGITLNSGRPGAKLAPDAIRSRFYKTSPSSFHQEDLQLVDIGNLDTQLNLEDRHKEAKTAVQSALENNHRWIGLGGGHDYGYPDGAGFLLANKDSKLKPLILNFDAHLDVRPTDKGLSSGTPFYRLLTEKDLPAFEFYEIGIQSQCNSKSHFQWLKDHGGKLISFEEIMMSGQTQSQYILNQLSELLVKRRPTYISIDIDGFSSAYAMGCSQSWSTGFIPNQIFPLFNILFQRLNVQALGIYEVSPPLDQDEATVKLASQIIHQFLGPIG